MLVVLNSVNLPLADNFYLLFKAKNEVLLAQKPCCSKYLIVIGIDHVCIGGVWNSLWIPLSAKCSESESDFSTSLFGFLIDGPVAVYSSVLRRLV